MQQNTSGIHSIYHNLRSSSRLANLLTCNVPHLRLYFDFCSRINNVSHLKGFVWHYRSYMTVRLNQLGVQRNRYGLITLLHDYKLNYKQIKCKYCKCTIKFTAIKLVFEWHYRPLYFTVFHILWPDRSSTNQRLVWGWPANAKLRPLKREDPLVSLRPCVNNMQIRS